MSKKDSNFPCKCGHEKAGHYKLEWNCTQVDFPFSRQNRKSCSCQYFKWDNLKYLEYRYEQSKKH